MKAVARVVTGHQNLFAKTLRKQFPLTLCNFVAPPIKLSALDSNKKNEQDVFIGRENSLNVAASALKCQWKYMCIPPLMSHCRTVSLSPSVSFLTPYTSGVSHHICFFFFCLTLCPHSTAHYSIYSFLFSSSSSPKWFIVFYPLHSDWFWHFIAPEETM